MRFSLIASTLALAGSTLAADHIVVAGGNGSLTFEPDTIQAAEGDTVTFRFWPKNHSVAQAAFDSPCQPLANGFWSGFIPSTERAAQQTFTYTVANASQPIWFYCTQGQHCQGGMVGVINPLPSGNRSLAAFKQASADANENVSPVSAAGSGGSFSNGTGNPQEQDENAGASLRTNSNVVFAGVLGLVAYALL